MALNIGSRFGSYEILQSIGAGGMGEVYKARDTKLGRDVAVKVLPDVFAGDSERLSRFQREAQVLAALNHPHIAQIYGLEDSAATNTRCIVMELVEGEGLDQRLDRGPLPVEEAIRIGHDIAGALEAAHDRGIIHRDLKPANVMVTPDGHVKVLDFGLAKAIGEAGEVIVSNSPTLSMAATQQGLILGTAAYMSPEQARGKPVDKRADVWSFGCVLYEMLTGKRVFDGSDTSEILAGVIKSEPAWADLPESVPPALRIFLRRCLEKDLRRRVHDIGDVRLALEGAFDVPAPVAAAVVVPVRRAPRWRIAALLVGLSAAAALAAGFAVWSHFRREPESIVRFVASPLSTNALGANATDPDLAISPDGSHVVYQTGPSAETSGFYVRSLDSLEPQQLRGLIGPRSPAISPDGNWIAYLEGLTLKKVALNGGPAVTITNGFKGAPRGLSWVGNDIVFATSDPATGLLRVSAGGGDPQVLTKPEPDKGELDHFFPQILPGGKGVLYTIIPRDGQAENFQIAVLDLATGKRSVLIRGGTSPHYAVSGHIVYAAVGTLRAIAFNPETLQVHGNPVPVVEHVLTKSSGAADFDLAQNGALAYITGSGIGGNDRTLVWVDRQGHEELTGAPQRAFAYPRISPDGNRVALDIRDQENDTWIWDFTRRTLLRLTFDPGINRGVAWSPDGKRVAFSAQRDGSENLYWQNADGTGTAERLTTESGVQFPVSFSPDGSYLLFNQPDAPPYDLGMVSMKGEHKTRMILNTPFNELNGEISPDGRWLAYESNESGSVEIYVRPFPDINTGRWQVSTGGGTRPLWARNGRELFYLTGNKMMAVPVLAGSAFMAGAPQMLFQTNLLSPFAGRSYDVSPDGRRFLIIKDARATDASAAPSQLVVVLNWMQELRRLVPLR
jgi:serine/threonine-protein kinase